MCPIDNNTENEWMRFYDQINGSNNNGERDIVHRMIVIIISVFDLWILVSCYSTACCNDQAQKQLPIDARSHTKIVTKDLKKIRSSLPPSFWKMDGQIQQPRLQTNQKLPPPHTHTHSFTRTSNGWLPEITNADYTTTNTLRENIKFS